MSDDEYDRDFEEPAIRSLTEAMTYCKKLRNFAKFHGYQELALTISKANDLLCDLKLSGPQRQTHVAAYNTIQ